MRLILSIFLLFWVSFSYSQTNSIEFLTDSSGMTFVKTNTGETSPVVNGHYIIYRDSLFTIYDANQVVTYSGNVLPINMDEYARFLETTTIADKNLIIRVIEMTDPGRCWQDDSYYKFQHSISKTVIENEASTIWYLSQDYTED